MRKKKGRKSLLFSLFCYFPVVEKDPSGILYIGIPHLFQQAGGLTASAAGAAVYKKLEYSFGNAGDYSVQVWKGEYFCCREYGLPCIPGECEHPAGRLRLFACNWQMPDRYQVF